MATFQSSSRVPGVMARAAFELGKRKLSSLLLLLLLLLSLLLLRRQRRRPRKWSFLRVRQLSRPRTQRPSGRQSGWGEGCWRLCELAPVPSVRQLRSAISLATTRSVSLYLVSPLIPTSHPPLSRSVPLAVSRFPKIAGVRTFWLVCSTSLCSGLLSSSLPRLSSCNCGFVYVSIYMATSSTKCCCNFAF